MRFETKAIRLAWTADPDTNAVISPIHLSTSYAFNEVTKHTGFDYSRSHNPTRITLERVLAGLEGGAHALAYASGMAATDAILGHLVAGDEIVAAVNLYGGTLRLFEAIYQPRGVKFVYVPGDDPADFAKAITPRTKLLWIESPTNPQLQLLDIAALAKVAADRGVPSVVDNTFASPFCQQPLALGATLVLHSTTKFIAGHHDVVGGGVITNDPKWAERLYFYQNTVGAVPSPFDCYLIMRGAKTLALRMRQHALNAEALARFLVTHPRVERVFYPGLESDPGHALAKRQMTSFGGMVTFTIKGGREDVNAVVKKFKIMHFTESLGGCESFVCHPTTMSHEVLSPEQRAAAGVTENMIRVSAGIEHPDDLVEDMRQALA